MAIKHDAFKESLIYEQPFSPPTITSFHNLCAYLRKLISPAIEGTRHLIRSPKMNLKLCSKLILSAFSFQAANDRLRHFQMINGGAGGQQHSFEETIHRVSAIKTWMHR